MHIQRGNDDVFLYLYSRYNRRASVSKVYFTMARRQRTAMTMPRHWKWTMPFAIPVETTTTTMKKRMPSESVNGFLNFLSSRFSFLRAHAWAVDVFVVPAAAAASAERNVYISTVLPSHRQLNLEYFIIEKRNP